MRMDDDGDGDTGYAETTEPEHHHYCGGCNDIWSHQDESCVGPRATKLGSDYDCPFCMGEGDVR